MCASGNANQRLEHTMSAVLKLVKNAKTPKAVKAVKAVSAAKAVVAQFEDFKIADLSLADWA
ncbi:MAG: hypothetical protein EAZ54_04040 [Curvibacter sp.]|nr:MAG: hypothetical protein EAZ54_04040 [Curvibacter sp.]